MQARILTSRVTSKCMFRCNSSLSRTLNIIRSKSSVPGVPIVPIIYGQHNTRRLHVLERPATPTPRATSTATATATATTKATDDFGIDVFAAAQMKTHLEADVYQKWEMSVRLNEPLTTDVAEAIAQVLLSWATSKGATHFAHWFQPMNGKCGEKHDTFLDMKKGRPILRFGAAQLLRNETDGSSFPSGQLRATHSARALMSWDPAAPPFIWRHGSGSTLYIPSVLFSWETTTTLSGQRRHISLDYKLPLKRSSEALTKQILRMMTALGETGHTTAHAESGIEQEFFLVPASEYARRPDLRMTGRTLVGLLPAKHQQMEDHYFGHPQNRTLDFIHELETTMWRLGVPLQTRHKEVAPGQFEVAPRFAEVNAATDQNQLLMLALQELAPKHGFAVLFHEKPFAGVNGSGKHNNWSFGTNVIPSLLHDVTPEELALMSPKERSLHETRLMVALAAVLRAIHEYAPLVRLAIASIGNDHRLGGCEAPPAIISAYLGDDLSRRIDAFCDAFCDDRTIKSKDIKDIKDCAIRGADNKSDSLQLLSAGAGSMTLMPRAATDRNRTSPIAFNGNKFEVRGAGSSQSPSIIIQVMNTTVADALANMTYEIMDQQIVGREIVPRPTMSREIVVSEKGIVVGEKGAAIISQDALQLAARRVAANTLRKHRDIVFNGNGYSQKWVEEAKLRGLPNFKNTTEIFAAFDYWKYHWDMDSLYHMHDVMVPVETDALLSNWRKQYITALNIEATVACNMARTIIIPAAYKYLALLHQATAPISEIYWLNSAIEQAMIKTSELESLAELPSCNIGWMFGDKNNTAEKKQQEKEKEKDPYARSIAISKMMSKQRAALDVLEHVIPADMKVLPSYADLLVPL